LLGTAWKESIQNYLSVTSSMRRLVDFRTSGFDRGRNKMADAQATVTTDVAGQVGRRTLLKRITATAGIAIGSGAITGFPTIWDQNIKDIVIRQIGSSGDNNKTLEDLINKNVPFKVQMTALHPNTVLTRGITQPDTLGPFERRPAGYAIPLAQRQFSNSGQEAYSLLGQGLCRSLQPEDSIRKPNSGKGSTRA
jgi:hypothetical protein